MRYPIYSLKRCLYGDIAYLMPSVPAESQPDEGAQGVGVNGWPRILQPPRTQNESLFWRQDKRDIINCLNRRV